MFRKRKNPTPSFRMPPPFQPISGQQAALRASGLWPYCVLMQVAKEDVHKNYCVCRGFDPRIGKFIDYAEGNADKPGIPVAKPYGSRRTGLYEIAQIFAAALPIQSPDAAGDAGNSTYRVPPSPTTAPIRLGQNPGKASDGHPQDLNETVNPLLTDEGTYINWMFLEAPIESSPAGSVARAILGQDMCPDDCLVSVSCVRGTDEAVERVSNWGFVGKSGDVVYIAKIGDSSGSGSESSGECDLTCDQGSGAGPEWEITSVTPRPLCPVSDVEVRDDCMVQIRSKMYGYYCGSESATAEKIVDLTDCEEGSGSGSESGGECDLTAEWGLTCPADGSGSETGS